MSTAEQWPLAEVKNRLSEAVEHVESQHARITITKHGRPAVVMISTDDLSSLEETLSILSNEETMKAVRESRAQMDQAQTLTKEEALAQIGKSE